MSSLDRALQRWRISKARRLIAPGDRVLDIGSGNGALFRELADRNLRGMGIDPRLGANTRLGDVQLVAGRFPAGMPDTEPFDAITMLAVLEHFPPDQYEQLRSACARFLKPRGYLIITVPSPLVDLILKVLKAMRLIDGMSLEEHHGFDVKQTETVFPLPAFRLVRHQYFQLGLNNLYVFERTTEDPFVSTRSANLQEASQ